jgi:hypothetical protein
MEGQAWPPLLSHGCVLCKDPQCALCKDPQCVPVCSPWAEAGGVTRSGAPGVGGTPWPPSQCRACDATTGSSRRRPHSAATTPDGGGRPRAPFLWHGASCARCCTTACPSALSTACWEPSRALGSSKMRRPCYSHERENTCSKSSCSSSPAWCSVQTCPNPFSLSLSFSPSPTEQYPLEITGPMSVRKESMYAVDIPTVLQGMMLHPVVSQATDSLETLQGTRREWNLLFYLEQS